MKKIIIFIVLFVNIILQVTLYNFIDICGVVPNITLVLIVIFSLTTNEYFGGLIGLVFGLFYDILIMNTVGIYALIYFLIGFFLGLLSDDVNRESKLMFLIATVVATIFYHFMMYLILFFLRINSSGLKLILNKVLLQIIFNAVLCYPLYYILNYIFNKADIKLFNNRS